MNLKVVLLAAGLAVLGLGVVAYKVLALGYELVPQASEDRYAVQFQLRLRGDGERASVRMFLPNDAPGQRIYDERVLSEGIKFYIRPKGPNRVGTLAGPLSGQNIISYRFAVELGSRPTGLPTPEQVAEAARTERVNPGYLSPEEEIQSDDARVKARLREITAPDAGRLAVVHSIYDYLADEVVTVELADRGDALTVLQKERGGVIAKARLFTALARAAGIPARIMAGYDLREGNLNDPTYWPEVHLAGRWIPADPVGGYFGSLPRSRLVLFEGDDAFVWSKGLSQLDTRVGALKEEVSQHRIYERKVRHSDRLLDQISLFTLPVRSQMTLRILLLIPFGALIVAAFRNLVGVPTFGTFMPVLLALAFLETTLLIGVAMLLTILGIGWGFRALLDRLQLLMIPRLSFLLTVVIGIIVAISLISEKLQLGSGLSVSLFPIVILTITIERFSIMVVEEGTRTALKATVGTLIVALACYLLVGNDTLQRIVLAFPELLFLVLSGLLLIGRYTGYRLSERIRFSDFPAVTGS